MDQLIKNKVFLLFIAAIGVIALLSVILLVNNSSRNKKGADEAGKAMQEGKISFVKQDMRGYQLFISQQKLIDIMNLWRIDRPTPQTDVVVTVNIDTRPSDNKDQPLIYLYHVKGEKDYTFTIAADTTELEEQERSEYILDKFLYALYVHTPNDQSGVDEAVAKAKEYIKEGNIIFIATDEEVKNNGR